MTKSSQPERAQRINAALALIKKYKAPAKAAKALAAQYGISRRQAYRYVHEAEATGTQVPIPDKKIAFTVKLSQGLIRAVRHYANSTGKTLSEVVAQALEAFLQSGRRRG
jgi:predicted DNA-binding transcriptional regulator YafY